MICNGNVIVSETNVTLVSMKSDIGTSSHVIGIEGRTNLLDNVNVSFHSVINEHHIALCKYQSNVEQTYRQDIRSRSPNASQADINTALGNAVEYARSSNVSHTIIGVEPGYAYTNRAAKELLPKYPDLIFLADTIESVQQSIAFYTSDAQFTARRGVGGHAAGSGVGCGICLTVLLFIIILAILGGVYFRINYIDRIKNAFK